MLAILLAVAGVALISLSISRWWIRWLDPKGWFIYWWVQYVILFFGIWALLKGGAELLERLLR